MKAYSSLLTISILFVLLGCFSLAHAAVVSYKYDDAGRLISATYGDEKRIVYTYDANGNFLSRTVGPVVKLTVVVSPASGGAVTGEGIDCPGDCSENYDENTDVALSADAAGGWTFLRWMGGLGGTVNPGNVAMTMDKQVMAYFGSEGGDTDDDGISDTDESGPNGENPGYDGNGNDIPDYQEAGVTSLYASSGSAYVTMAVPQGQTLLDVSAVVNPSPGDAPESVLFPYGFFAFAIHGISQGTCTTLTLYLPRNTGLNTYYKYGPTPDNPTDHWYEFLYDGQTGAQIFHDADQTRVILHLCDGQRGDDDLAADTTIIEPGGPGDIQNITVTPALLLLLAN